MNFSRQAALRYEPRRVLGPSDSLHLAPVKEIPVAGEQLTRIQKLCRSLVALALVFVMLQAFRGIAVTVVRLARLVEQEAVVSMMAQKARAHQQALREKISLYRSPFGIEEIARERLDLVRSDEVLVRLYTPTVATR